MLMTSLSIFKHIATFFSLSFPIKNKREKPKILCKKLSVGLNALADYNVDLAILGRDSGDPNSKSLSKQHQKEFRRLSLREKRDQISTDVQDSDC